MAFFSRRLRWVPRTLRTSASSSSSFWILRRMWRRSVSSCVSPGPRVPMGDEPPEAVCRTRWVHMPVRRGSRYLYCASSTCNCPSRVLARWAKISRMSPERSSTFTPSSSDRTRIWEGESSLSKTARSHSFASISSLSSFTLPSPRKLRGSGAGLAWIMEAIASPPAVSTRAASSSMVTSLERSCTSMLAAASPASTARSFFVSLGSMFSPLIMLYRRGASFFQMSECLAPSLGRRYAAPFSPKVGRRLGSGVTISLPSL